MLCIIIMNSHESIYIQRRPPASATVTTSTCHCHTCINSDRRPMSNPR